jgi:hypothetical protein
MNRTEIKEIVCKVLEKLQQERDEQPETACVYGDGGGCDMTTLYAVGEEG